MDNLWNQLSDLSQQSRGKNYGLVHNELAIHRFNGCVCVCDAHRKCITIHAKSINLKYMSIAINSMSYSHCDCLSIGFKCEYLLGLCCMCVCFVVGKAMRANVIMSDLPALIESKYNNFAYEWEHICNGAEMS